MQEPSTGLIYISVSPQVMQLSKASPGNSQCVAAGVIQPSFASKYTILSSHKTNSEYNPLLSGSIQLYPIKEFLR